MIHDSRAVFWEGRADLLLAGILISLAVISVFLISCFLVLEAVDRVIEKHVVPLLDCD